MCRLRAGGPRGPLGTSTPLSPPREALSFDGCCGEGMTPPAPHAVSQQCGACHIVFKSDQAAQFKVQIKSPEAQEMLQECCPWLPKTPSLFTLAALLRGRPWGTVGQLGEARGGLRHMGKQTDPDRGMSQRTGPATLPPAKTALRGWGWGSSPCYVIHPSRWQAQARGAGLSAQLTAADPLGQGMKPLGPAAEHGWAPDSPPPE